MFVRLTKKLNDRVSIRIVENKRINGKVKQKTVTGVGTAHKEDIKKIEMLKRVGNSMIIKIKNDIDPVLPGFEEIMHTPVKKIKKEEDDMVSITGLEEEARTQKGIQDVFGNAFKELNLFDSINTGNKKEEANILFQEIVLARLSNPVSKRKSVKEAKKDKGVTLNLDKVYRMMDKVHLNSERIKHKISSSTLELFNQKIDVTFFDVTTLYFERFTPDNLRSSGYSIMPFT